MALPGVPSLERKIRSAPLAYGSLHTTDFTVSLLVLDKLWQPLYRVFEVPGSARMPRGGCPHLSGLSARIPCGACPDAGGLDILFELKITK